MRMSGGTSVLTRPIVTAAVAGLCGAFALPCQTVTSHPEIVWRTDFDVARETAAAEGKLLFVVVHQAGEPGNEAMLRSVYRSPRLAKALEGHVVALCCHADVFLGAGAAAAFEIEEPETLAAGERRARAFLFGTDTVITPQQLILHPDGGVLWHSVRQRSLQHVLRGIQTAERRARMSAKKRAELAATDGVAFAKRAERDGDQYAVLSTLVRHSPASQLWRILGRLDHRSDLCERLLRDALRGMGSEDSRRRLAGGRAGRHASVVAKLMRELDVLAEEAVFARAIPEDLEVLGQIDLSVARFAAGATPSLASAPAGLTVLWLFLPGDETHARQIAALTPVVKELRAEGVQFLGLAATLKPAEDLERIAELGFPFETGTFRYAEHAPLGCMKMFPGAMIVDRGGDILYRTGGDPDALSSSYTEFEGWVRGLLQRQRAASPRPLQAGR